MAMSAIRLSGLNEAVPLAGLSTLGVGGPARYYLRAAGAEAVTDAASWSLDQGLPLLILGGGSNLVVSDDGFPGLVVHLQLRGVQVVWTNGAVELTAAAGEPWDPLVERTVAEGWAGLECLSGIPGLVGATPMQNVGAYGQDVSETITRVRVLDLRIGKVDDLTREECHFGYRDSRFKREDRGRYVVLAVTYRLRPGGPPSVRYVDLERHLAARGIRTPTLADARRAVIDVRRRKSMVIDPDDPNRRSVGSFFMNPVVHRGRPDQALRRLAHRARRPATRPSPRQRRHLNQPHAGHRQLWRSDGAGGGEPRPGDPTARPGPVRRHPGAGAGVRRSGAVSTPTAPPRAGGERWRTGHHDDGETEEGLPGAARSTQRAVRGHYNVLGIPLLDPAARRSIEWGEAQSRDRRHARRAGEHSGRG
jgi:UDP-N-acetylmuramate dehydrogenase